MKTKLEIQNIKKNQIALLGFHTEFNENTFDLTNLKNFIDLLQNISKDNDGLILYSLDNQFFSNGLNRNFLQNSDSKTKREILHLIIQTYRILLSLEKVWIVEISGHCVAGGAVIAMAADYRFMLQESGRFAFSEVSAGNLFLPLSYIEGLKHSIKKQYIKQIIEGTFFKTKQSKEIGLLDEIFENQEQMRNASLSKMKKILRLNPKAYRISRNLYRNQIIQKIQEVEKIDINTVEQFI